MKNIQYLLEYAKAQLGKPYWFGCFGQVASEVLYRSKKAQYPRYYTAKDFSLQYGKRVHDCAGLIKGALWSESPTSAPKYNASQDYSANMFYIKAVKKGLINTMPDKKGILVFKGTDKQKNHIGVYIGNGKVIEAKGHAYGVVESNLNTSWKYWGQCNLFDYGPAIVEKPAITPTPAPSSEYTAAEIKAARDCILGKYGNGMARRNNLAKAGFNYDRVQSCVNKILRGEIK